MSRKSRLKQRKQEQQKQNKQQRIVIVGVIAVVIVAIAAIVFVRQQSAPGGDLNLSEIPDTSVVYDSQGRTHINLGDPHEEYNSNPPTSGSHASPLRTQVYTVQQPDENLIHNLEHGHVWLSYRDADDQEALDLLRDIQSQFPSSVVVTYRPDNDARIAAAAWTRLLKLEEADSDQILAFIRRYIDDAPESIPG